MRNFSLLVLIVAFSGWSSGASAVSITNGLVGAWEFTENADDSSGNENHGVVHGATLTTDRFGNANSAYSFDGVDDYIFVTPNLGGLTEFTKTLWIAPRASIYGSLFRTPNGGIGYDSGSSMLSVDVIEDRQGGMLSNPYSYDRYFAVPFSFVTDQWTHVAFVGNADNSTSFFVDGVEISWSSSLHDDGVTGKLDGTIIGATYKSNETPQFGGFADAVIDDLYLYSRALSPAEIATLANVPEPSTALLLGVGLAGLGMRRRQRTRRVL